MKVATLTLILAAMSCRRPPGPDPAEAARASARCHSTQALQVLDLVGSRIEEFFGRRQEKVQAFSDEIFSLRGKWRAMFWGRDDFERHVRRRFENHVFRPEDFDREVVIPIRADLAFAIDASEAGVAADLDRWARAGRPGVTSPEVRPALTRLVADVVLTDLGLNVASIAGSEAAAVAASAILTRAGILGASVAAGAGTSWATLGISLVVGAVVGIIIDSAIGEELEETARETVRLELDALRMKLMESRDGLWWAALRALQAHGRALERSAERLVEGSRDITTKTPRHQEGIGICQQSAVGSRQSCRQSSARRPSAVDFGQTAGSRLRTGRPTPDCRRPTLIHCAGEADVASRA